MNTQSDRIWNRLCESPAIRDMLMDYTRLSRESAADAAKRDPRQHKLTLIMDGSTSYRYWSAGTDGRGRTVRFCWSCHRNAAGYFLSWREVSSKAQTKRDQFSARKTKAACEELARRRQNAWVDRTEVRSAAAPSDSRDAPNPKA